MSRYFKSVNKGSVQLDVFYGWDIDVKEWFIDVKISIYHTFDPKVDSKILPHHNHCRQMEMARI